VCDNQLGSTGFLALSKSFRAADMDEELEREYSGVLEKVRDLKEYL